MLSFIICIFAALGQPALSVVVYNVVLARFHEHPLKKAAALVTLPGGMIMALAILLAGLTGHAEDWIFPVRRGWIETARAAYLLASALGGMSALTLIALHPRNRPRLAAEHSNHSSLLAIPRQSPWPYSGLKAAILRFAAPFNQLSEIEINLKEIELPHLPLGFDGFKIAHITDLHVDRSLEDHYFQEAVRRIRELAPDLVVMTGDYVSKTAHIPRLGKIFSELNAPKGVYYVLGNHDFWTRPLEIQGEFDRLGFHRLSNRSAVLESNGGRIALVGAEHPWGGKIRDWSSLSPKDSPACRIVLLHSPDAIAKVAREGCDLALAGHTHGGQIQFPWVGPTLVPSDFGRRYAAGWSKVGGTLLYVNRGLGAFFPVRILCRPEISVFVLRAPCGKTLG